MVNSIFTNAIGIFAYFIQSHLNAEALSRKGIGSKSKPPHLFVNRGPGTGKTYFINCIKRNAEQLGLSVMTCAYAGSAVDNLPKDTRTIHGMFVSLDSKWWISMSI